MCRVRVVGILLSFSNVPIIIIPYQNRSVITLCSFLLTENQMVGDEGFLLASHSARLASFTWNSQAFFCQITVVIPLFLKCTTHQRHRSSKAELKSASCQESNKAIKIPPGSTVWVLPCWMHLSSMKENLESELLAVHENWTDWPPTSTCST